VRGCAEGEGEAGSLLHLRVLGIMTRVEGRRLTE